MARRGATGVDSDKEARPEDQFNIPEEDVADVIVFLKDYGYETCGEQAAGMFEHMEEAHKRELVVHIVSMARADGLLHDKEVELIQRVGGVLGYSPEQIESWL